MREKFPKKRPGDSLPARHVNELSRVARRLSDRVGNSGVGALSTNYGAVAVPQPWRQRLVIVTEVRGDDLYYVQQRFYDHYNTQWRTDNLINEWEMDASDYEDLTFEVDDKVVAYWDAQRGMFIPICCAPEADKMWCAEFCECVLTNPAEGNRCCLYRGRVKRFSTSDGEYTQDTVCDPQREIRSAFIMTDCDLGNIDGLFGWVRLVQDAIEITWTPSGLTEPITEVLPLFEWCCWRDTTCPAEDENITATFGHPLCSKVNSIPPIILEFRSQLEMIPPDNAPPDPETCPRDVYAVAASGAGSVLGFGWVAEFKVESPVAVRVFGVSYTVNGIIKDGWVWPHWLTGEIYQLYEDVNGDLILETGAYDNIVEQNSCMPYYDANDELVIETVDRWYRLRVSCTDGEIDNACIELLYPPGHPIYNDWGDPVSASDMRWAIATEDADPLQGTLFRVCDNEYVALADVQFGTNHDTDTAVTAPETVDDGYFDGKQFETHIFAGCITELGADCTIPDDLLRDYPSVSIRFSWA